MRRYNIIGNHVVDARKPGCPGNPIIEIWTGALLRANNGKWLKGVWPSQSTRISILSCRIRSPAFSSWHPFIVCHTSAYPFKRSVIESVIFANE